MGNLTSKRGGDGVEDEGASPGPEEIAKTKKVMALLDPRSPSVGVARTPVEVVAEREKARLERSKRLQALGLATPNTLNVEDGAGDGAPTTAGGFLDPRSPTVEYKRTPIALDADGEEIVDSGLKEIDSQQVPNIQPAKLDLRKRLFVDRLNESINSAGGVLEEDKEN